MEVVRGDGESVVSLEPEERFGWVTRAAGSFGDVGDRLVVDSVRVGGDGEFTLSGVERRSWVPGVPMVGEVRVAGEGVAWLPPHVRDVVGPELVRLRVAGLEPAAGGVLRPEFRVQPAAELGSSWLEEGVVADRVRGSRSGSLRDETGALWDQAGQAERRAVAQVRDAAFPLYPAPGDLPAPLPQPMPGRVGGVSRG